MTTGAGLSRLPYQIMGRMRLGVNSGPPWTLGRRRDLHKAMEYVRKLTVAWAQLAGARAPVLYWYVVDLRDGTEHHVIEYYRRLRDHGTGQG